MFADLVIKKLIIEHAKKNKSILTDILSFTNDFPEVMEKDHWSNLIEKRVVITTPIDGKALTMGFSIPPTNNQIKEIDIKQIFTDIKFRFAEFQEKYLELNLLKIKFENINISITGYNYTVVGSLDICEENVY